MRASAWPRRSPTRSVGRRGAPPPREVRMSSYSVLEEPERTDAVPDELECCEDGSRDHGRLEGAPKHPWLALAAVVLLAALLRLPFLGANPNGLFCDEACIGYDAYSILKTGRDKWGTFLPLYPKQFGSYNEVPYTLMVVPAVAVLGLTEFAVRLPAALAGILTVLVVYFLAAEVFDKRLALLAAMMLAMSPWHVHFSRMCFRGILLPLVFSFALLLFLKSKRDPKYIVISSAAFAASLFTYHAARVFVPIFVLCLVIVYRKHLWAHRRETCVGAVLFLLVFVPVFRFSVSPAGMARANGCLERYTPNIKHYVTCFSPQFLFAKGDPNWRFSARGIGELQWFECLTVPIGLLCILRRPRKESLVLLTWLALYSLPGGLLRGNDALRTIVGAPVFAILSGCGLAQLTSLGSARAKWLVLAAMTLIVALCFSAYWKEQFLEYPKYSARSWQYGMREAVRFAENDAHDCVIVSDRFLMPHVFILFYTQYSPREYQRCPAPIVMSDLSANHALIGKYRVDTIGHASAPGKECLFIIEPGQLQQLLTWAPGSRVAHSIALPTGESAMHIVVATMPE